MKLDLDLNIERRLWITDYHSIYICLEHYIQSVVKGLNYSLEEEIIDNPYPGKCEICDPSYYVKSRKDEKEETLQAFIHELEDIEV